MSSQAGSPDIQSVRAWRKESQRAVRSCFSTLDSALGKWEAARGRGLQAATSLVNCHLNARFMASRDLGVLSEMKDIRALASAKLHRRQVGFEKGLFAAYEGMVSVLSTAETAVASLTPSPLAAEATARSPAASATSAGQVAPAQRLPVFSSLPLEAFDVWATEILSMWQKELLLKSVLLSSLSTLSPPQPPAIVSEGGGDHDSSVMKGEGEAPPEAEIQVYLTLWLADVHVDKGRIKELLTSAFREMEGY